MFSWIGNLRFRLRSSLQNDGVDNPYAPKAFQSRKELVFDPSRLPEP